MNFMDYITWALQKFEKNTKLNAHLRKSEMSRLQFFTQIQFGQVSIIIIGIFRRICTAVSLRNSLSSFSIYYICVICWATLWELLQNKLFFQRFHAAHTLRIEKIKCKSKPPICVNQRPKSSHKILSNQWKNRKFDLPYDIIFCALYESVPVHTS